jgi:hypothetical protein
MTTSKYLESKYPSLTRFVNEIGRVEIGVGNYMPMMKEGLSMKVKTVT